MTDQYYVYFVWQGPAVPSPFRVVHREVKARTNKGYPISYVLKSIPREFDTYEEAQAIADELNANILQVGVEDWMVD